MAIEAAVAAARVLKGIRAYCKSQHDARSLSYKKLIVKRPKRNINVRCHNKSKKKKKERNRKARNGKITQYSRNVSRKWKTMLDNGHDI